MNIENLQDLKEEFTLRRNQFTVFSDHLIKKISDKLIFYYERILDPFGGRAFILKKDKISPLFVKIEMYALGEIVIKFRDERKESTNYKKDNDIDFSMHIVNPEKLEEKLEEVINEIYNHCKDDCSSKLKTSIEEFTEQNIPTSSKILQNVILSLKERGNANKNVKDILNLKSSDFVIYRYIKVISWKKLMLSLYQFGIKDCFDYPIAKPYKDILKQEMIDKYKKEITSI